MNQFGITEKSFRMLMETFTHYPQVEEVIIFGSRAKGNYKKGSDIDLAIKGKECTESLALTLGSYINEKLPIPYMVDVLDYRSLKNQDLRRHIDRVGIKFYSRDALI
ncbi:MAG: nucleotidyltransferase domain-containing protein [Thermincola sp.]|jgi:predicted nucleotidyltransferase|nr:nucleotidyltransferase domain-containing protein [Thermincola sp.]MDT3702905.1 nucleotidyltransferase domain-containing protein [Thermincola sp.]